MDTTTAYACDISDYGTLRIAGEDAPLFVQTMFSGALEPLDTLFGVSQGLLLSAQGEVIDVVSVVRTGDAEYLVLASPANTAEALEWLQAHAELERDGKRAFAGTVVEDQSDHMAVLVVYGAGAAAVLGSLKEACDGQMLFIDCALPPGAYGVAVDPAFLLFAPLAVAAQVGEFLQGCLTLEAVDFDAFLMQTCAAGRYNLQLDAAEYRTPAQLGLEHLLRSEHDFVGARALFANG